jgi:hypothetical protein
MELAMWIPALLFVGALMLNFGTVVVWRARGEIASRDGAWRNRMPREAAREAPLRPIWPADAKLVVNADRPILQLDHPAIHHPVVRGPLPNGFVVRDTLDPNKGMLRADAAVTRNFPLLPKIGPYRTGDIPHSLLVQLWPCRETRNYFNLARRIPAIYQLPTTDPSLPEAFVNADRAILSIPHYEALSVLDRDEEVFRYRGFYPDFHPRIRRICELDVEEIQRREVNRLIVSTDALGRKRLGQVTRLPRTMTAVYLGMYQSEVARLEAEIEALEMQLAMTTDPTQVASMQAQIAANQAAIPPLEAKIDQLEDFQRRIPDWERMVLAR